MWCNVLLVYQLSTEEIIDNTTYTENNSCRRKKKLPRKTFSDNDIWSYEVCLVTLNLTGLFQTLKTAHCIVFFLLNSEIFIELSKW